MPILLAIAVLVSNNPIIAHLFIYKKVCTIICFFGPLICHTFQNRMLPIVMVTISTIHQDDHNNVMVVPQHFIIFFYSYNIDSFSSIYHLSLHNLSNHILQCRFWFSYFYTCLILSGVWYLFSLLYSHFTVLLTILF